MSNISDFHYAVSCGNLPRVNSLIDLHGISNGYQWLRVAVVNNDTAMVKLLLSRGCPVTKKSKTVNNAPLHIAVRNGNIEIIELLLEKESNVNARTEDDLTPLHIACQKNIKEIVSLLLMRGAYMAARTQRQNSTPLHLAAQYGSSDVVSLLLQHGAQVDCEDKDGETALQISVKRGELPVVEAVLKFHPDVQNVSNQICLKTALRGVQKDFHRILVSLLEYGFAFNTNLAKDPEVLHGAVDKGKLAIVAELLKCGADPNAKLSALRSDGYSPLHKAVRKKHYPLAELLIKSKADIDAKDSRGRPPLFHSVDKFNKKMMQLLLTNGANVRDFPEVLHLAVWKNSVEILNHLLLYGADVNVTDEYGRNALHFTVFNRYETSLDTSAKLSNFRNTMATRKLEVSQLLLNKGANVDAQTKSGQTALHAAVLKEIQFMVDFLLMNDASVNLKDKDDTTALHMSAAQGNVDVCTALLSEGAEINARKKDGNTALHFAASYGNEEVVKLLLDKGALANCKGQYGKTPLHLAAYNCHAGIIESLLSSGANVNIRSENHETPLHLSSQKGHTEAVAVLLKYGADINITKTNSYTPLDYAWSWFRNSRPRRQLSDEDEFSEDEDEYQNLFLERRPLNDAVDILILHQLKMMAAGLEITKPAFRIDRNGEHFKDFQSKCQLEVTGMKSEFVNGTNVSYYEILRKDKRSLAKFLKNENIALAVKQEDYKSKFPIYESMIKCQFRDGLAWIKLLESASEVLNRLTDLPEDCIEKIMDFLTEDDLTVLMEV